jgi:hypothetical protein
MGQSPSSMSDLKEQEKTERGKIGTVIHQLSKSKGDIHEPVEERSILSVCAIAPVFFGLHAARIAYEASITT